MTALLTEGDVLLREIIANPGADDLRLIYADWLGEHGQDDRAEFIRIQVSGRGQIRFGGDVWMEPFEGRAAKLVRMKQGTWTGVNIDLKATEQVWQGGFISEIRLPLAAWQQHGPALVQQHPITRAELSDRRPGRNAVDWEWLLREDSPGVAASGHAALPRWLFLILAGGEYRQVGASRYYSTEKDAVDAASDALLRWAKPVKPRAIH